MKKKSNCVYKSIHSQSFQKLLGFRSYVPWSLIGGTSLVETNFFLLVSWSVTGKPHFLFLAFQGSFDFYNIYNKPVLKEEAKLQQGDFFSKLGLFKKKKKKSAF